MKTATSKVAKKVTKVKPKTKQVKAPPGEADPIRRFYTSLFIQTQGKSDMAREWCEKHGLLQEVMAIAEASNVSDVQNRIAGMQLNDPKEPAKKSRNKK